MAQTAGNAPAGRLQKLDCVRGIAILLVLGAHLAVYRGGGILTWATTAWHRGGWIGVDLFFALSGFLVGGLLFREFRERGRIDFKRFLIRRGFKIYPLFWIYLLSVIFMKMTMGDEWPAISMNRVEYSAGESAEGDPAVLRFRRELIDWKKVALAEFLFAQNYFYGFFFHTWSLAVEEHFYIILALSLWLVTRVGKPGQMLKFVLALSTAVAISCLAFRLYLPRFYSEDLLSATHLRLDSLMAGAALAAVFWFKRETFHQFVAPRRAFLILIGAALLSSPFVFEHHKTPYIYTFGFTAHYVGAAMIVASAAISAGSTNLLARMLAWIGRNSFAIYLWHFPTERILRRALDENRHWFVYTALYLGGSILIGAIATRVLERPILALRDRLFPRSLT